MQARGYKPGEKGGGGRGREGRRERERERERETGSGCVHIQYVQTSSVIMCFSGPIQVGVYMGKRDFVDRVDSVDPVGESMIK